MTVYLNDHPCTQQLIIQVHVATFVPKLYIFIINSIIGRFYRRPEIPVNAHFVDLVVVDQFTPGYQFTATPKFIQNNHS